MHVHRCELRPPFVRGTWLRACSLHPSDPGAGAPGRAARGTSAARGCPRVYGTRVNVPVSRGANGPEYSRRFAAPGVPPADRPAGVDFQRGFRSLLSLAPGVAGTARQVEWWRSPASAALPVRLPLAQLWAQPLLAVRYARSVRE